MTVGRVGADCASAGEIAAARRVGIADERIVVHGNAKSEADLRAALGCGLVVLDGRDEAMRVYEFRLDPGAHGTPPARSGGGEAVLLGQGLLLVTMTDGSTPVIREGEALFSGDAAVADWRNLADDPAVGFWVGV